MHHPQTNTRSSERTEAIPQPSTRILNSWKEIASYLGRGVRTIQRYEEKLGLPVHRPAAKDRSAVLAFADELERWLRNTPSRNGTRANAGNANSATRHLEEIQLKDDVRSELERAKQEVDLAHDNYVRKLERYTALKRQAENTEASSRDGKSNGKSKRVS